MTPSEQRHRRHWDLMTYPERLRFISTMFAHSEPDDVAWETIDPFKGHDGWWFVRWDG